MRLTTTTKPCYHVNFLVVAHFNRDRIMYKHNKHPPCSVNDAFCGCPAVLMQVVFHTRIAEYFYMLRTWLPAYLYYALLGMIRSSTPQWRIGHYLDLDYVDPSLSV